MLLSPFFSLPSTSDNTALMEYSIELTTCKYPIGKNYSELFCLLGHAHDINAFLFSSFFFLIYLGYIGDSNSRTHTLIHPCLLPAELQFGDFFFIHLVNDFY